MGFIRRTFYCVPSLVVLVCRRIAGRLARIPLDHQRVQINHREMIMVHIHDALPRDARRQRRNRRKHSLLRHREQQSPKVHLFQISVSVLQVQ